MIHIFNIELFGKNTNYPKGKNSGDFCLYLLLMSKLDPHTLFSIFEQGDEEIYKEHGIEDTMNNPYVLINMVVRGLENYRLMDMMYMRQYAERYKQARKAVKYKYYNNLLKYLKRINIDEIQFEIGDSYELTHATAALEDYLYYYERLEQYEKCAIIVKYVDLLKKSYKKVGSLI